ncbi:hypothetical protein TWF569_004648 [Orbilia oligospora]|uniref:Uncharacterized protein n=1 Tax=Orbilia oligospora TaxID=2813651 RepID=A0A7C8JRB7_ORBOL|nr:hypothetical protein TWF706_002067 [Orbilia oligospora]KAF3099664.1 hypothetical protein TWF103_008750 [Orbilia oligospora]KAF3105343.1 hypothetical protein TWF102_002272 [Orbilia oligospora]KAF3133381.1 hypothetical protein TWF703_006920 [Orbilia oligospora]KAF3150221.1 hypothetical protein TWF594_010099 [Orbilia oligospora]
MDDQNDVLITSVLYIILSLAGIPLLLLLIWLTCQLYKNQMERIRFRNQLKQMEEGLAAANAAPAPDMTGKQPVTSIPVSQNGGGVFMSSTTTNTTEGKHHNDENDNESGREEGTTIQDAYHHASEDMRRWKEARDLFVKRGGQADLAEVLRSQSRAGREEEQEEQVQQQTYVREYSPPPRLPTL